VPLAQPIELTPRLRRRVEADYGAAAIQVAGALERVDLGDWRSTQPPDGRERVLAAVLVLARGDPSRIPPSIEIVERDWRDALVWAELGQPDWPARVDALLGPRDGGVA
jgi:hypothetical protein